VTAADAGWSYVTFGVHSLGDGEGLPIPSDGAERALVPLSGRARAVSEDGQKWEFGGRASVFDGVGWCLYLPRRTSAEITAVGELEIAVASAPATRDLAPVLVSPADIPVESRGGGNASRQVSSPMLPAFPADRLHVVEVWTPGGNWSSFPPHKHDEERPGEARLEELYYYRLRDPARGWAVQRVYRPDRGFDLVEAVQDGDLCVINWGYHTTVAAHGHDLYYLNVLAGPGAERTLQAFEDPGLAPLRQEWPELGLDARVPLVPRFPGETG
jgi:5-deoxy-glucuronate isomerase